MREKRKSQKKDVELVTEGDEGKLRDAVMQHVEHRHSLEREVWGGLTCHICALGTVYLFLYSVNIYKKYYRLKCLQTAETVPQGVRYFVKTAAKK